MMKKEYVSPELEKIWLTINSDVLNLSDPESTDAGGGAGQGDASSDPFGGF